MSFNCGIKENIGVSRLVSNVVSNCRKACGEHDVLTRDVVSMHVVLRRLKEEALKPGSLLNHEDDDRKEDLEPSIEGCSGVLAILDNMLEKYNALDEKEKVGKRLWSKIKLGNGEMQDLGEVRVEISTYASAITLQLNLVSMGSQGRVEQQISNALPEIREALNWITAKLSRGNEGSILTSYSGDDKGVWRELRRGLVLEGFASPHIKQHKTIIMDYIKELGERGLLDDPEQAGNLEIHPDMSSAGDWAQALDSSRDAIGMESSQGERRQAHQKSSDHESDTVSI